MAREFKEVANLRTDKKKFDSNYDRIFGKKKERKQDERTEERDEKESEQTDDEE